MKLRYLVPLLLLATAFAAEGGFDVASVSCSAVITTGACTALNVHPPDYVHIPSVQSFSWQTTFSGGTATSVSVTLEGSLDGSTWTTYDTSTNTSGELRSKSTTAVTYFRCNVGTYSRNGTSLSCSIMPTRATGGSGSGATSCSGLSDAAASCSTDATLVANVVGAERTSNKNSANGYAGLDAGTKIAAGQLPTATTTTLGGVKDIAAVTNNFITSIVGGVPVLGRPTCGNLSDSGTGCSATLAAVATSGSATDLGSGTLNNARLPGAISVTTLTASGAVTGSSFVGTAAGGVGNNWLAAEGTDPGTEATGQDLCWSDSAAHAVKCSFNNDTASQMARASNTLAFFAAGAIANGSTATSQTQNSNDTKVATDAYVDRLNSAPLTPCSVMPTTVHVGSSNFTSSASGQTAITGLAFTLPGSTACNYVYQCHLVVNEATSASVLTFSVNDVTTAPTNMIGWGRMSATVNADSTRVLVGSASTGSQTLIALAPGASATNLTVMLDGFIEQPSGTASVVQFELGVTGGTNVTTISRGSNCWMHRE